MTRFEEMSHCEKVRELLWPLDELREAVEGEAEARAHLEECPHCQAFFRRDAALSSTFARIAADEAASSELRSRVLESLEAAPVKSITTRIGRRRLSWAAPLAAAAAIAIVAAGLLRVAPQNLDALYVESYRARDTEPTVLASPGIDQAYEFFMRELGVPVTPVLFGEGRVNRAMICMIEGRRTAMVEYELQGHMVAHYRGPVTSEDGGGSIHTATEDGVCVVRWSDGEFEHALVADIPEDELRVIAEEKFAALR